MEVGFCFVSFVVGFLFDFFSVGISMSALDFFLNFKYPAFCF